MMDALNGHNISYSLISTYLQCPRKALAYIQDEKEDSYYLQLGKLVHKIVSIYLTDRNFEKSSYKGKVEDVLMSEILSIENLIEPSKLVKTARSILKTSLNSIINYVSDKEYETEKLIKLDYTDFTLKGYIDLVVYNQSTVDIIDFKTNRPSKSGKYQLPNDNWLQWKIYAILLSSIAKSEEIYIGRVWYLRTDEKPYYKVIRKSLITQANSYIIDTANKLLTDISKYNDNGGGMEPKPNWTCRFCSVSNCKYNKNNII